MKKKCLCSLVFLLVFSVLPLWADVPVEFVSSCMSGCAAYGVAVSGDYAYVAVGLGGLAVVNISNPAFPYRVGDYYSTGGWAENVAISGSYAYVASGETGLHIFDISNPAALTKVGMCPNRDGYGYAHDIALSGRYVYMADGPAGLQIVDISNPSLPAVAGWCDVPSNDGTGVAVSGNYAYFASWFSGMQVINVSNASSPFIVGGFSGSGVSEGVAVSGGHAYFADGYSGLKVLDISNPTLPLLLGSCSLGGVAEDVVVVDNYAYVADGSGGVQVVDIANPSSPVRIGGYGGLYARGLTVSGKYIYAVADRGDAFVILRVENTPPATVTIRGMVYDDATNQPLAGATVLATGGGPTQTDANGQYEITGLSPGQITVTASKEGYETQSFSKTFSSGEVYPVNFNLSEVVIIDTNFLPSKNGFNFGNPDIDIGITHLGYCLGMTYAALNYFTLGIEPDITATGPGGPQWQYINYLQIKYSISSAVLSMFNLLGQIVFDSIWVESQYNLIRESIVYGRPCPIGLLGTSGGKKVSHMVLAYKIEEKISHNTKGCLIYIYNSQSGYIHSDNTSIAITNVNGNWQMQPYGEYNRFSAIVPSTLFDILHDLTLAYILHSPATIRAVDPTGQVIDCNHSDVDGGYYRLLDIDGDGHNEQIAFVLAPKEGLYSVTVIPDTNAEPNATYSLEEQKFGKTTVIDQNVPISEVPADPYESIVVLPAMTCEQALVLMDYNLVDQNRVSRTEFEYTFRLRVANSWIRDLKNVTVRLVGEPNNTTVLDDTVAFSFIQAGTEVLSDDTFKICTDRTIEGVKSDVVWQICDCKMERRSDFNHDWSVDTADLVTFTEAWLMDGNDMPQDLYPDHKIDFVDFAMFADEWAK